MRRRAFLASVAAGSALLAGCETPSGAAGTPTPSTRTTTAAGPIRAVTAGDQPDAPFRHEVSLLGQPSDAAPAELRVSVTNTGDAVHELRTNNYAFPFPDGLGRQQSGRNALVLSGESEQRGGCRRGRNLVLPAVRVVSFDPGETFARTYPLVNHVDNASCWPPGTYSFAQRYGLDPTGPEGNADPERAYSWGFDVTVG